MISHQIFPWEPTLYSLPLFAMCFGLGSISQLLGTELILVQNLSWTHFRTSGLLQNWATQCKGNLLGVKLINVTRAMCTFWMICDMCKFDRETLNIAHVIHYTYIVQLLWNFYEIFEIVHIVHIVRIVHVLHIVNYTWCTFDGEKHRGNFTIWLGPLRRPLETLLISPLNHHHLFLIIFLHIFLLICPLNHHHLFCPLNHKHISICPQNPQHLFICPQNHDHPCTHHNIIDSPYWL